MSNEDLQEIAKRLDHLGKTSKPIWAVLVGVICATAMVVKFYSDWQTQAILGTEYRQRTSAQIDRLTDLANGQRTLIDLATQRLDQGEKRLQRLEDRK